MSREILLAENEQARKELLAQAKQHYAQALVALSFETENDLLEIEVDAIIPILIKIRETRTTMRGLIKTRDRLVAMG